ncbi:very long chain fatty acid elongase 4-like [Culicoides brevitarsis]|uniref:very long chain fatty acid elongase 4-like n=1 Tax=Culicoides brevitarsis TaxID=469753 RepID=UPI00307B8B37
MTSTMSLWDRLVDKYNDYKIGADPEVDQWFLMKSPGPVFFILISYLSFVLFIGPRFMRNRKPFELKTIIIAYNAMQVVISAFLVTRIFDTRYFLQYFYGFGCTSINEKEDLHFKTGLFNGMWYYTMAKLIDLVDTCFFVLRKKQNHVSFLHVYHHIGVILFSWCILKYATGPESLVVGLFNSAVHVVMYAYYLVAALGPAYKKYLWWKKYLTVLQLVQFFYIFFHMTAAIFLSCQWNKVVIYAVIINAIFHIFLFSDFYKKTYNEKEKLGKKKD